MQPRNLKKHLAGSLILGLILAVLYGLYRGAVWLWQLVAG